MYKHKKRNIYCVLLHMHNKNVNEDWIYTLSAASGWILGTGCPVILAIFFKEMGAWSHWKLYSICKKIQIAMIRISGDTILETVFISGKSMQIVGIFSKYTKKE